jgi:hypothetical protein
MTFVNIYPNPNIGPPGTGKTHVGLYASLVLLKNYENDSSLGPIVCICQTNHGM